MQFEERVLGCLLGLAIGDALGYPVEFMNHSEIADAVGQDGVRGFVETNRCQRGQYSDDTQMTIALLKGLLSADTEDLDDVMRHTTREFIQWANSPENNRAPGQSCMDGCFALERGRHWFSSGDPYSKGCGAAMRSAPVGLMYSTDPDRLIEVARAVAICTHGHPTALASSIAVAAAVAYAMSGKPVEGMVNHLLKLLNSERGVPGYIEHVTHDPLQEQTRLLNNLNTVLAVEPAFAFDHLGGGWIGEETVAGALYCFLRSPDDFRQTVLVAANASRSDLQRKDKGRCDSDSIACVAGAISGARNGIRGIPPEWIDEIENRDLLFDLGKNLAARAADRHVDR